MNKFEILLRYKGGKLSTNKVQKLLGMTEKGLNMAMYAYRDHLEWLVPALEELKQPTKPDQTAIKNQIAEKMGISYNQVNRMLRTGTVDVPRPEIVENREKARENAQKRREITENVIKKLATGEISFKVATEQLKITPRQVSRHLSDYCAELGYSVPAFKRLHPVTKKSLVYGPAKK